MEFQSWCKIMRERLTGIVAKRKQKDKDELNASGVSPEHTLLDEALEEIEKKWKRQINYITKYPRKMQKCSTRCSESPRNEAACIRDPCWNKKTTAGGAYIWNQKNPDLLGQKHLFTYERKLKKIRSLKEYSDQYSILVEIHILTGNEKLCKIYWKKLFFQNV